jgi:hypothetical protein
MVTRSLSGERKVSSTNGVGIARAMCRRMKLNPSHTMINSKWTNINIAVRIEL